MLTVAIALFSYFAPTGDKIEEISIDEAIAMSQNGEIEKIEDKKIFIKIRPLHPLANPDLDTRIIEISDETEIFKMERIKTDLSDSLKNIFFEELSRGLSSGFLIVFSFPEVKTEVQNQVFSDLLYD